MTGATIDIIVDMSALIAEITEMSGGIVETQDETIATGGNTDGGVNGVHMSCLAVQGTDSRATFDCADLAAQTAGSDNSPLGPQPSLTTGPL